MSAPTQARETKKRRSEIGEVLSTKMDKTIVVQVVRVFRHPKYEKFVRRAVRFFAHDEKSEAKTGDMVEIMETRPLSKRKRWRLVRVVRAKEV